MSPRGELQQQGVFANVMVGVDGEQGGRDAIALARRLALPGATLTLAHVCTGLHSPFHTVAPGHVGADREDAEELLGRERERAGIDAELVVSESSSPARGLHELAEAHETDLLVLGSCRRGVFARATLGDDTRAALNGAPCAVAVAPAGYEAESRQFARIGVGYDASDESAAALTAARALAHHTGATVRALRVVGWPHYMYTGVVPPAGEGADELLRRAESDLRGLAGVDAEAIFGTPREDLASFSRGVDLLVVGSRGYGPARRLVEGSTSRYLLGHSRAPLLVMPRGVAAGAPAWADREAVA